MSRLRVADDIIRLVGETPMLQLKRLVPPGSADIFAKLEYLNPGGSVKDRAAIGIIRRAEQEGQLRPGGTIVEATAGNTGIGLALIGVNRGYKVKLFVPEKFSEEKVMINIEKYGNTTAATIPLCLWDWEKKLKKGDNLVFAAFGGGFTWGATLVKWAY